MSNTLARLMALERLHYKYVPTAQEYEAADARDTARQSRYVRQLMEMTIIELGGVACMAFKHKYAAVLGLPWLWDNDQIAEDTKLLEGDTEAQTKRDEYVCRQWRRAYKLPTSYEDDPVAYEAVYHEDIEEAKQQTERLIESIERDR